MPTEKPRVTFTVSKETLDEIDLYRFASRSKNQSQAILSLIERWLENCEKELKKNPLPPDAVEGELFTSRTEPAETRLHR